jgi:hypothetical protein
MITHDPNKYIYIYIYIYMITAYAHYSGPNFFFKIKVTLVNEAHF